MRLVKMSNNNLISIEVILPSIRKSIRKRQDSPTASGIFTLDLLDPSPLRGLYPEDARMGLVVMSSTS